MLDLNLHLLSSFLYCSEVPSFPLIAELSSDQTVELATKVDVKELTLTLLSASSEDDFLGTIRRPGIGVPQYVFELMAFRSKFLAFDVFEDHEEDIDGYQSGEYLLRLRIDVFEKRGSDFHVKKLIAERIVVVK